MRNRRCARNCIRPFRVEVRHLPWSVVRFSGRDQPWSVGAAHPPRRHVRHRRMQLIDAIPTTEIVITAERAPEEAADTPASVIVIDSRSIERLGEPLVPALLRLTPSVVRHDLRPGGLADRGPHPRRREQPHPAVHRRNPRERPGDQQLPPLRAAEHRRHVADRGRSRAAVGALGLRSRRRRRLPINGVDANRDAFAVGKRGRLLRVPPRLRVRLAGRRTKPTLRSVSAGSAPTASTPSTAPATATATATCRAALRGTWQVAPALRLGVSAFALSGRSEFDGFDPILRSSTPTPSTAAETGSQRGASGASSAMSKAGAAAWEAPSSLRATAISLTTMRSIARPDKPRDARRADPAAASRLRRSSIG